MKKSTANIIATVIVVGFLLFVFRGCFNSSPHLSVTPSMTRSQAVQVLKDNNMNVTTDKNMIRVWSADGKLRAWMVIENDQVSEIYYKGKKINSYPAQ